MATLIDSDLARALGIRREADIPEAARAVLRIARIDVIGPIPKWVAEWLFVLAEKLIEPLYGLDQTISVPEVTKRVTREMQRIFGPDRMPSVLAVIAPEEPLPPRSAAENPMVCWEKVSRRLPDLCRALLNQWVDDGLARDGDRPHPDFIRDDFMGAYEMLGRRPRRGDAA